jgi:hypothetical protein
VVLFMLGDGISNMCYVARMLWEYFKELMLWERPRFQSVGTACLVACLSVAIRPYPVALSGTGCLHGSVTSETFQLLNNVHACTVPCSLFAAL